MDTALAQVLAVRDGHATVAVDGASACPRCAAGKGCGAGLLAATSGKRELELPIGNGLQLAAGDLVQLSIASSRLLRASIYAYGLPLAGIVAAVTMLWLLQGPPGDGVAVGVAAAGLGAGWLGGRRMLRGSRRLQLFQPEIVARRNSAR